MSKLANNFSGAWLTDIDDTLIRSGHYPDDEWIASLADFIRQLQKYNIVWAPVSGVAINKMGARLLFRLPKDVLSHVIYYGGEGGVKSYFKSETDRWYSPDSFKRSFSDVQSLVVIGEQRFADALTTQYKIDGRADDIQARIGIAKTALKNTAYNNMPSLVDQMEHELEQAGYEPAKAETYFRGGAISWMMFGDISVQHYRGEAETLARSNINQFINNKLVALNFLKDIGDHGIHMPYLHATRGIKLVLMGNDKSRAAVDLIDNEAIARDSLIFVGNELFAGGNDNPVRQVKNIAILSVGENEDSGVIDGGIQVDANKYWMNTITDQLNQGGAWPSILQALPDAALSVHIRKKIELEKTYAHNHSDWHHKTSQAIATDILLDAYLKYGHAFKTTRKSLLKIKRTQFELVTRLAALEKYHYDNARKIIMDVFAGQPSADKKVAIQNQLKQYLLPEISGLLKLLLVDHLYLNEKRVSKHFKKADDLSALRDITNLLIERSDVQKKALEFERKNKLIDNWDASINEMVDTYFDYLHDWEQNISKQTALVTTDESIKKSLGNTSMSELCDYFRWLISRIDNYPHLKDLDKPTIILVAGTSGVGKSTISRHISKTMGIPTTFSSDVASRSVVRETIIFLLGRKSAEQLFPEVIGSSFAEDKLEWFYAHALMTMVGIIGNINRLIKENISAVIDGVALIPGSLPEIYFEKANIVWIVASVSDRQAHFERLGTRSETGVERGGAERYRDQFSAIRHNHDRLVEMAHKTDTLTVDNSRSINKAFKAVLKRVNNPIADRGLHVDDKIRDKVYHRLHERSTWDIQNILQDD